MFEVTLVQAVRRSLIVALYALVVSLSVVAVLLATADSYNLAIGTVVLATLTLVTVPFLTTWGRRLSVHGITAIMLIAFGAKMAATVVQYLVVTKLYGISDAASYYRSGGAVAESLRRGQPASLHNVPGSGSIEWLAGLVHLVIGPSMIGAFFFFSWLGFLGILLFFRAFCVAVPEGNHRRYAQLVLLLPSLLYWPSALGKDAYMLLALGFGVYGVARLLSHSRGGFVALLIGLTAASLVRPHIALLLVVSVCVGYFLAPASRVSLWSPIAKFVGLIALFGLSTIALSQFQEFVGIEASGMDLVQESLSTVEERSTRGGSSYDSLGGRSLADIPAAVVTVLYRPWPWEVASLQGFAASLEGVMLAVMTLSLFVRRRRFFTAVRQIPFVRFAVVYVCLFCLAFSNIGNFGIIVRERVQVLPLLLVVIVATMRTTKPRDRSQMPPTRTPGSALEERTSTARETTPR